MEKGVLPNDNVVALLKDVPRVALFIDKAGDPAEAKHMELMLETYNKSGSIPAYYVIDGTGAIKAHQIGASSEEEFLKFLEQGGIKAP